jgi:hypothetical protein
MNSGNDGRPPNKPTRPRRRRPVLRSAPIAILIAALFAPPARGGELIKPTLDLNDMRVFVVFVSTGELVNLHRRFGANVDLRELRQDYRHGFSVLKTHKETGARTCEIYLPEAKRPREVDDEATLSLGHELLHCMRGDYHR